MHSISKFKYFYAVLLIFCGSLFASALIGQTLSLGRDFAAYIDADGNLYMWGANANGQLGTGDTEDRNFPVQILPAGEWAAVSVSNGGSDPDSALPGFVLAVRTNGSLWVWGANQEGQLGLGDRDDRSVPTRVGSAANWAEVSAGGAFSMATNAAGQVFVWGNNAQGQLARTTGTVRLTSPTALHSAGSPTYQAIAAGYEHALAIRSDGALFGWGKGTAGQIGHTTNQVFAPVTAPQQVGTWTDWVAVSAADIHSHGIRTGGELYSWGSGASLGLGSSGSIPITSSPTPARVGGALLFSAVSTYGGSSMALASNGDLYGMGSNVYVELGIPWYIEQPDGTLILNESQAIFYSPKLLPIANVTTLATGHRFSAVLRNGVVLTTGINTIGQLGNGSTDPDAQVGQGSGFESSVLGIPDLRIDEVELATITPTPGANLGVQIFLTNGGTGAIDPATPGLVLRAELSTQPVAGLPEAIPLTFAGSGLTLPIAQGISAAGSLVLSAQVELPASIPVGQYYIVIIADSDEVLEDSNRNNNTRASNEALAFEPDLVVSIDTPAIAVVLPHGNSLPVELTVSNIGTGTIPAGSSIGVDVFLAPTASATATGRRNLLTNFLIQNALPSGGAITLTFAGAEAFLIDESFSPKNYFVGATVDPLGLIPEISEANNSAFTASALVEVTGLSLADALQVNPTLSFTTFGAQLWFGQTSTFIEGTSAGQSPALAAGETSTVQTSVPSASILTFQWKAETTSTQNFLSFRVNGIEQPNGRIFGGTDWQEVSFLVPANTPLTWVYVQGNATSTDRVFLDAVAYAPVVDPDFIIQSINGAAGTYILGGNDAELTPTLVAKNQGASATVGTDFSIDFYLSPDDAFGNGTETLIGSRNPFASSRAWNANELITLTPLLPLPNTIASGNYYLIAVINAANTIAEIPGFGADNNVFISAQADITVEARPDLRVSSIATTAGYYDVGDDFNLTYVIENIGLAAVSQSVPVRLILSPDSTIGNDNDFIIEEYVVSDGIPAGGSVTVNPSFLQVSNAFPKGQRLYLGVHLDPQNTIPEVRTNNNTSFFPGRDFIFNEIPVAAAMGFDAEGLDLLMNTTAPFGNGAAFPFIGQSAIRIDEPGAAQNIQIERGQNAAFGTTIVTATPTVVSFYWKVSCDPNWDRLNFLVNNAVVRTHAGDRDWERVSVPLPAGTHLLNWVYEKDLLPPGTTANSGLDRGWVTGFSSQLPDMVIDPLSIASGSFAPGTPLSDFEVTIRNIGVADAVAPPSYAIEFRLTQNPVWGGDGDIVLGRVVNDQLIAAEASRTFTVDLNIPEFAPNGQYYLGAFVDPDGVLSESVENNNSRFTISRIIEITSPIPIADAADYPGVWTSGGNLGWFSVADSLLPDGSRTTIDGVSALQSAPIAAGQESWVQTTVTGPKILTFDTKVSSRQSFNQLQVSFNGLLQTTLSGDLDWTFGMGGYTLSYSGQVTNVIRSNTSAAEIEAALNALPSIIAAGGVTVVGDALDFTVTFVENGNRAALQVTPRLPDRVTSSGVSVVSAGNSSGPSEQQVTIVHNVTYRVNYRGQLSAPIPYNATAAEVAVILNAVPNVVADGQVTVAGADLDFEVTFNVNGERERLIPNISGLRRPGTVETDIIDQGDVVTQQRQKLRIGPEITLFVPAGMQEVRWTYNKTGSAGNDLDAAWIDRVGFTDFLSPELAITAVNYTAGEYVLDVEAIVGQPTLLLGTRYLDISVEAENFGVNLPVGVDGFTSADIQVRLSLDAVLGNEDDIILGNFNQIEGNFDSQGLMRFLGPIALGDHIPAGDYHLIVIINSTDRIEEFTVDNNVFVSEAPDIRITRLPLLRLFAPGEPSARDENGLMTLRGVRFDEGKAYFQNDPVRATVEVNNRGLARLEATQDWENVLSLRAVALEDLFDAIVDVANPFTLSDFVDIATDRYELGRFSAQRLLEGRSEAKPDGDVIAFDIEFFLPSQIQLRSIIDEDKSPSDYLFFYEFEIDPEREIRMTDFYRTWYGIDWSEVGSILNSPFVATWEEDITNQTGIFPIYLFTVLNAAAWEALYPGANTLNPPDLTAYAFNRNPFGGIPVGVLGGGTKLTEVAGEEYLSVVFDIQRGAEDLRYTIQVSEDLIIWVPLIDFKGPFNQLVGPNSLTGDGGLIDNPLVLSIVEGGSNARITVRDDQPVSNSPQRFMRILVQLEP